MAEVTTTFRVGDRLPPIALPDPDGAVVDLSNQRIAGHTFVLWLAGDEPDGGIAAGLAAAAERFAALDATVFAVTKGGALDGLSVLCDAEARLARAVGLAGPGMIVLDPERRLSAVLSESDGIDQALSVCARIYDRSAEAVVRAQAPVLVLHEVISPEVCQRLIRFWESGEKMRDGVSGSGDTSRQANRSIKRRADVPLTDKALFGELSHAITNRVAPPIRLAFQRVVTRCETMRIGCYDAVESGVFGPHRDNATPYTAHRLFAMSVNLNDGYVGGELHFPEFGRTLYRPDPGGAVVFSCNLLHEALPVREGRRFGLFAFLYDEEGAKREQEMLARERAAGRDPTMRPPMAPG